MKQLIIEETENGFIVYIKVSGDYGMASRKKVFESAKALGEYTEVWGNEVERNRLMKKGD